MRAYAAGRQCFQWWEKECGGRTTVRSTKGIYIGWAEIPQVKRFYNCNPWCKFKSIHFKMEDVHHCSVNRRDSDRMGGASTGDEIL